MDDQPANILFLFPDQQRPDGIGSDTGLPLATPNLDGLVGRFVEAVEARGELAQTLIVFASDHGEMLGDIAERERDIVGRLIATLEREWRPDLTHLATSLRQMLTDLQDSGRYPLEQLPQLRSGLAQLRDGFLPLCEGSEGFTEVNDLVALADDAMGGEA